MLEQIPIKMTEENHDEKSTVITLSAMLLYGGEGRDEVASIAQFGL